MGIFLKLDNKEISDQKDCYRDYLIRSAQNASPDSWRLPTIEETKSLLDIEKVKSELVIQNNISGRRFTDIATNNSIFFPASDYFKITYYNHSPQDVNLSIHRGSNQTMLAKNSNNKTLKDHCSYSSYHSPGGTGWAEECFAVFDRSCGYLIRPVAKQNK